MAKRMRSRNLPPRRQQADTIKTRVAQLDAEEAADRNKLSDSGSGSGSLPGVPISALLQTGLGEQEFRVNGTASGLDLTVESPLGRLTATISSVDFNLSVGPFEA